MQKGVTVDDSSSDARGNPERACTPRSRLQRRRRRVQPVVLENAVGQAKTKSVGRRNREADD